MTKITNVLDPIQKSLDKHVFVNNRVRASVAKWLKDHVYGVLEDHFGFDCSKLVHLYLTGSLTTFQYHATSDFDVNLFVDYIKWPGKPDAEELKKQILRLIFRKIDHKLIPGTDHPLQCFILPAGIEPRDQFDVGMRSAWSFDKSDWVIKPEKDRIINVMQDLSPIYQKAMRTSEKMRVLLDQDPEQGIKLYHKLHKKRQRENALYGDFSEGNIIYKFLDSEGLFTKLRALGVKIAQIHEASWQDIEQKAKRYIEEGRFTNVINNGDFFSAEVNGDTGVWQPQIWKDDPNSRAISRWACTCPWGQNSWGRTRSWIKYEGRPCAHILGLHWLSQGTPKDYKEDLDALIPDVELGEAPKTPPLTPPDEYPLKNGDFVVVKPQATIEAWDPHNPEDRVTIPQNTVGQILEQVSENLVRVVFPNPTGWYHENKLYEALENPNMFYVSDTSRDPFVKRPPGWQPNAKLAMMDEWVPEPVVCQGCGHINDEFIPACEKCERPLQIDKIRQKVVDRGALDDGGFNYGPRAEMVMEKAIPQAWPENWKRNDPILSKIAGDDIWEDFNAATPENERLRNEMNEHLERPWRSPLFTDEILQQKLAELEAKGFGHESTARSIRLELIWRSMGEIT